MIVLFNISFLHADIIGPSKAITGETVIFHCVSNGILLRWSVDGKHQNDDDIKARMICETQLCTDMSGVVCSNLTVPATLENNGTTLRCCINNGSTYTCGKNVTFTVGFGK